MKKRLVALLFAAIMCVAAVPVVGEVPSIVSDSITVVPAADGSILTVSATGLTPGGMYEFFLNRVGNTPYTRLLVADGDGNIAPRVFYAALALGVDHWMTVSRVGSEQIAHFPINIPQLINEQDISGSFTCANFLAAVRELPSVPDYGAIYRSHVAGGAVLSVPNRGITSLNGIQYFTNIENIIVQGNNLTELDLCGLSRLRHLNASNNNLTTLDVSDAAALAALSISRNNISTITGLETLENLEVFWAEGNAFASLAFHPGAPLERIDVRGNTPSLSRANITGATADALPGYESARIFQPRTWVRLRILSGLAY